MSLATLTFARRLEAAGVNRAHADAVRDAVADATPSKADLQAGLGEVKTELATKASTTDLQTGLGEVRADLGDARTDLGDMKAELATKASAADLAEVKGAMATKADLLRVALALAALMVLGFGALLAAMVALPVP